LTQRDQEERRKVDRVFKELKAIKNLLIVLLLKTGATLDEVNYATGMGVANISRIFPVKRGRKKLEFPMKEGDQASK
jgi:uncharacterized protein YerC